MNEKEAQLLRAFGTELHGQIERGEAEGRAAERLGFGEKFVTRMAATLDVEPEIDDRLRADYRDLEREVARLAGIRGAKNEDGVRTIRKRLALVARRLGNAPLGDATDGLLNRIIDLETRRRLAVERALARPVANHNVVSQKTDVVAQVTADSLTRHLRQATGETELSVTKVRVLPGGRSKWTLFINFSGSRHFPKEVVMRQDTGSGHIPTSVIDEYPVLLALSEAGLPVPRPLFIERQTSTLGGPFLLVERLEGVMGGEFFAGFRDYDPDLAIQLAGVLGRMHAMELSKTGYAMAANDSTAERAFKSLVSFYQQRWESDAMDSSPLVESGYAWLLRETDFGRPVLVHGDLGSHNTLLHHGKLSGLLDWELQHVGDAGEDLGCLRPFLREILPWDDFMRYYRQAGGEDVSERRILRGQIWTIVRNSTFSAGSAREFAEGTTDDFAQGAHAYFVLPQLEAILGPLLERAMRL